jgi:hypothetical protein
LALQPDSNLRLLDYHKDASIGTDEET